MKSEHIGARISANLKEKIQEKAQTSGLTVSEYLESLLEEDIYELDPQDSEALEEENNSYEEPESPFDFLGKALARELDCEMRSAWQWVQQDPEDSPEEVAFLERLADRLWKLEEKQNTSPCEADEVELPEDVREIVEELVEEAIEEAGQYPARPIFFRLLANLLDSRADSLYQELRTIEFDFSRADWVIIDRMVGKANRRRKPNEQFEGIEDFLLFLLAREMKAQAGEWFFGTYDDEEMGAMAKRMEAMIIEEKV